MNSCIKRLFCCTKALPFVFIALLIGWSYYAYVVAMCIYSVPTVNLGEKVSLIVFYHVFLIMFSWSYIQTTFAKPVVPPDEFKLSDSEWSHLQGTMSSPDGAELRREFLLTIISDRDLPVYTRGAENSIRLCEVCHIIKPDRAHHCSTCGLCLLKMDHHCPWVNNCVGLHNYKFFVLFLLYGSIYCLYVGGTSAKYFVSFWQEGVVSDIQAFRFHVLFLFFAAWMFSVSLLALGGYHLYLAMRNQTTLESFRAPILAGGSGPDKRAFHVGTCRNFRQVFGDNWELWFLPLPTWQQDGVNWSHRVACSGGSPGRHGYSTMEQGTSGTPSRNGSQRSRLVVTSSDVHEPAQLISTDTWLEAETNRR